MKVTDATFYDVVRSSGRIRLFRRSKRKIFRAALGISGGGKRVVRDLVRSVVYLGFSYAVFRSKERRQDRYFPILCL